MNAAARFASQNTLSRGWILSLLWLRVNFSTLILSVLVLSSALSLVYITNAARSLNASYQEALSESDHLRIQWNQLLLEKSTWVVQARVQEIAENKLGMMIPDRKSIMILNK
jgi:cell division protein FtsL